MTPVDVEITKVVISNSFSLVTLAWSSGLAWWLSSLVFVLTLLGKLYPARESFYQNGLHTHVGMFVVFILVSLITFGSVVIHDLSTIETTLYTMFVDICSDFNVPRIDHIFSLVRKLYVIVTSSLVVFLIAWLYLWFFGKRTSTTVNGR